MWDFFENGLRRVFGTFLRMVRMSDFSLINKSWSGNMTSLIIMVWNFYIFENGPNTVDGLADRRGCGVDHSSFLMSGLCMGQTPIAIRSLCMGQTPIGRLGFRVGFRVSGFRV